MTYERKTRDLCQTDWQDVNPGEYAPNTIRYGTCAECGSEELVYRSTIADEAPEVMSLAGVYVGQLDS